MYTNPHALVSDPVLKLIHGIGYEATAKRLDKTVEDVENYLFDVSSEFNIEFFDKHNLKIQTKAGDLIPFLDNGVQKRIQDSIERQSKVNKPVRIKIPKARRHGVSTKVQSLFFRDAIYAKNITMMTICHDLDSSRNMREMFNRFYENYPRWKPKKKTASDKWWKFDKTGTSYLIDTADELDTGRSWTLHRLHCSETAFYRDPDTLMTGLLRSVDRNPNTIIIMESTANGLGGWWYDFVVADNEYELLFFPWFDDPGNSVGFENEKEMAQFETSLQNQESSLREAFSLSLEQLNWRRQEIKNGFNGDEDMFKQEYPATVEESFITSGRPYFPIGLTRNEFNRTTKAPYREGNLEWIKYGKEVEFVEQDRGWWRVFSGPNKEWKHRYLTGSDVAEGVAVDGLNKDPDFSVCTIFDRVSKSDAARLVARIDTDIFADEIYKASIYYKSGCDVVERNSAGVAVVDALKHKENIILFKEEELTRDTEREKATYGFRTGPNTRDMLLTELRTWVREKFYNSNDNRFWHQCSTFIVDEKGKPRGANGTHDDIVLSAALALQGQYQAMPPERLFAQHTKPLLPPDADVERDSKELAYATF